MYSLDGSFQLVENTYKHIKIKNTQKPPKPFTVNRKTIFYLFVFFSLSIFSQQVIGEIDQVQVSEGQQDY